MLMAADGSRAKVAAIDSAKARPTTGTNGVSAGIRAMRAIPCPSTSAMAMVQSTTAKNPSTPG
jgi:hypothetical protein